MAAALLAAGVPPQAIDGMFHSLVAPRDPGAAVMVRQNGRTVFVAGYGVSDLHSFGPISPATNFRLASVSKQFTAAAVMLLVKAGKLRYAETLAELFSDFPDYGRSITVRQLLTHTSGLPDYEDLMGPQWSAEHQINDEEVLGLLKRQSHGNFAPGTSWAYSNSGYVMLGLIVNRVSGEPFPAFLRERIFRKLGMKATVAYVEGTNQILRRAYGFSHYGSSGFVPSDQSATSATLGDGGVYSNLLDLAKWDDALRNNTLLDANEMEAAFTPVRLASGAAPSWPLKPNDDNLAPGKPVSYGFGWFLDPYKGHERTWHFGSTSGFRTAIDRFTRDGLSVVILTNRTDLDPASLALRVADLYLPVR